MFRGKQTERLKKKARRIGTFLEEHGVRLGRNGKEVKSRDCRKSLQRKTLT